MTQTLVIIFWAHFHRIFIKIPSILGIIFRVDYRLLNSLLIWSFLSKEITKLLISMYWKWYLEMKVHFSETTNDDQWCRWADWSSAHRWLSSASVNINNITFWATIVKTIYKMTNFTYSNSSKISRANRIRELQSWWPGCNGWSRRIQDDPGWCWDGIAAFIGLSLGL